jgi:4-diphosphocytidyl-2-C-methyl-D-erythritol kinase
VKLSLSAPAKVNLALEVLGRREDGFHEIRSVVQTIGLCDRVDAELASDLRLSAAPEPCPPEQNLALIVAYRARAALGVPQGARLSLAKGIPVGAGLGGGSSDAATTLRLLRRLWNLEGCTRTLGRIAAELGSDVPLLFVASGGLVSGRGERIQPLPRLSSGWFVLVVPPWREPRKTARVYEAVSASDFSCGEAVLNLAATLRSALTPDHGMLVNGLQRAARQVFPRLAELHARLEETTAAPFTLSGAGPSLFHLAPSRGDAERVARLARPLEAAVEVVRPLARRPRVSVTP